MAMRTPLRLKYSVARTGTNRRTPSVCRDRVFALILKSRSYRKSKFPVVAEGLECPVRIARMARRLCAPPSRVPRDTAFFWYDSRAQRLLVAAFWRNLIVLAKY